MTLRTPSTDQHLLEEFQSLIKQVGREVVNESVTPAVGNLINKWQSSVDKRYEAMVKRTNILMGLGVSIVVGLGIIIRFLIVSRG